MPLSYQTLPWSHRWREPGTAVLVLSAVLVILSLSFLFYHLREDWHHRAHIAEEKVDAALQSQAAIIRKHLLQQEHLIRQLGIRLNQVALLTQADHSALQDVLRQFTSLIPGTRDLLLVWPDGRVMAGAEVLSGARPLSEHCPVLAQSREAIERRAFWVMPGGASGGRCPAAQDILMADDNNRLVIGGGRVWVVLDPRVLMRDLEQQWPSTMGPARYRLIDFRSGQSLDGTLGQGVTPRWQTLVYPRESDHTVPPWWQTDAFDPATARSYPLLSQAIEGTDLRLEVLYDTRAAVWPQYRPHVAYMLSASMLLLCFGGVIVWVIFRSIRAGQHAIALKQRDLEETAKQTQAILDNMVDAVITIDTAGKVLTFNPAAERIFGYPSAEVVGQKVNRLMPEPFRSEHDGYLTQHANTGERRVIGVGREALGLRKAGDTFPIHLSVSKAERSGQTVYIGVIRDISAERQAEAEIERLAYFDAVTGLPNRRLLQDRLDRALLASVRRRQFGALMMIDLDDFKALNDTHGHASGDELLKEVSTRLEGVLRNVDTVARLGGDEFVVLTENLGDDMDTAGQHAHDIADKLLGVFDAAFYPGQHEHYCSGSIGVCLFGPDKPLSRDEALSQADMAMYQAKRSGRRQHHFYDSAMQVALAARTALEADMRQGLALQQYALHYQPQVDASGRVVGAEALLRWQHPVRGFVSPGEFIPLAEQTGLIVELGHWVLATACGELARWSQRPELSHLTLAVNVSAHQFKRHGFVGEVLAQLAISGANPFRLKIELTESTLADDVLGLIDKMDALRAHGVQFSLDDFGTGYSSLSYIKRLPLQQLKVDQGFVRNLLSDANDASIVRAIVTLGNSLGLAVIAEGVETDAQRAWLLREGCQQYQGYLFSRPLPVQDFESFVTSQVSRPI